MHSDYLGNDAQIDPADAQIDPADVDMHIYSRFINEPIEVVDRAYNRDPEKFGRKTYIAIRRAKGLTDENPYPPGSIQSDLFASGLSEKKISQYLDPDTLEFTQGSPMFTHPAMTVYEDVNIHSSVYRHYSHTVAERLRISIYRHLYGKVKNRLEARKEAFSGAIAFNSVHKSPDPHNFNVSRYRVNYWSPGEYFSTLFVKLDPTDYVKWLMLYPIAGIRFGGPFNKKAYIYPTVNEYFQDGEPYNAGPPLINKVGELGALIGVKDTAIAEKYPHQYENGLALRGEYGENVPAGMLSGSDHIHWGPKTENPGLTDKVPSQSEQSDYINWGAKLSGYRREMPDADLKGFYRAFMYDPESDTAELRQNYLNAILQFKSRVVWKHLQDSVTVGDAILSGDLDTNIEALKHALQLRRNIKNLINNGSVEITVAYPTQAVVIRNGLPTVNEFPINKNALASNLENLPEQFLQKGDPVGKHIRAIPGEVVSVAQVLTAIADYAVYVLKSQIMKLAASAATIADPNAEAPDYLIDPDDGDVIRNGFWELDVDESLKTDKTVFHNTANNEVLALDSTPKVRTMIAFTENAIESIPDTIDMYDRKIPLVGGGFASPADLANLGIDYKEKMNLLPWLLGGAAAALAITQFTG